MTKILSWLLAGAATIILLAAGIYLTQLVDLQEFTRIQKIKELDSAIAKVDISSPSKKIVNFAADVNRRLNENENDIVTNLRKEYSKSLTEKSRLEARNARSLTQRLLSGELNTKSIVDEKLRLYLVRGKLGVLQQALDIAALAESNRNSLLTMYEKQKNLYDRYMQHRGTYNKKVKRRTNAEFQNLELELADYNSARRAYITRLSTRDLAKKSVDFSDQKVQEARQALENDLQEVRNELAKVPTSAFAKTVIGIRDNLWKAFCILVGAVFGFIGLRTFNYYVLSRLARKGTPLTPRLAITQDSTKPERVAPTCSKSEEITLNPEQTLFVRGRYIKSEPGSTDAEFKPVLDWHCPITCLSAGLVALTVYRNTSSGPVVLVPRGSAVGTLLRLEVAEREELCLAARNLVAIVTTGREAPRFRKIWKLGSAHSWLSGQFRYLLVSGPCEVILEGSHSLVATAVSNSRQVESGSALAFSGHLAIGAERTSSFGAYLFGTRPLFEEVYTGRHGILVHQHVVHIDGYRASEQGGFLKTVLDVMLKLVGI